jgi:hypothetical protein
VNDVPENRSRGQKDERPVPHEGRVESRKGIVLESRMARKVGLDSVPIGAERTRKAADPRAPRELPEKQPSTKTSWQHSTPPNVKPEKSAAVSPFL